MRIINRSNKAIFAKFDTDRAYLTESIEKLNKAGGFNVNIPGVGGGGADWSEGSTKQTKWKNELTGRGY